MPAFDEEYFRKILAECREKCSKKQPSIEPSHLEGFVEACQTFYELDQQIQSVTKEKIFDKLVVEQEKTMKQCVKAANKILDSIDLNSNEKIVTSVLKGMIITRASPEGLAYFCSLEEGNGEALEGLLKSAKRMKEMLGNGGAKGENYGQAIVTYNELAKGIKKDDEEIYKKLAMAVALELAIPIYEFDTEVEVDPMERYNHYVEAYRNGELDPAFPHFSIWELRHVVNCDAKDDQMKWGRDMLLNYAPYFTVLTVPKEKYTFICQTDGLMRAPTYTASPLTYQQLLSGGGYSQANASFGRFIAKAHGIPTWGCQVGEEEEAFTRWTPSGWETMMNSSWESCIWEGVTGTDFKNEVDTRSSFSSKEYFNKLTLLECFAEVLDHEVPEDELSTLHPSRVWRSLSIIQKALMLLPTKPENFVREGTSKVKSRLVTFLERYEFKEPDEEERVEDGVLIIPVTEFGYAEGKMRVIESFQGGKQLNLAGAEAKIDFTLPDNLEGRTNFSIEVNTVHEKQIPLSIAVDEGEPISHEVPYTAGVWSRTADVKLDISGGETVRISRSSESFGLAIRNLRLK